MFTKKKLTVLVAISALAAALTGSLAVSTSLAGTPPQDAHAVLLTPFLDGTNTSEAASNQKMADGWVANGWFGTGVLYQRTFVPVGSTDNLTYHVTDKNGAPLVNQVVKLRVNKGYSTSSSIIQVDNLVTKGVDKPPLDQGDVFHTTDAFGNVTFSVKDLDGAPLGEPQPDSWTAAPNISADGLNDLHSQMLLEIAGEKPDHSVFTEFHYYIPKSPVTQSATTPTLKLVAPVLDATNSFITAAGTKGAYVTAGSTVIVAYKVLDDAGVALPNASVQIKNGASTLTAVSDAMGYAVFTIKDTHAKGEAKPASVTTAPAAAGAVALSITPTVTGATSVTADALELHYFGAPAVAKAVATTISCVKGKTIVKVNGVKPSCPKGYTKKK
ncbi:MAG: hypothetical protein WCO95_02500 [Actinomycetes bacterium]